MPAERMPQAHDSFLAVPLRWMTALAIRFPKSVLLLALLFAAGSVCLAVNSLGFRTSRLDLLNPESRYNQRWLAYLEAFGEDDDAVVVVESSDPAEVTAVLDQLAARIAQHDTQFHSVIHKKDLSRIRAKGLHFFSVEELRQLDGFLSRFNGVFNGQWSDLQLTNMARSSMQQLQHGAPAARDGAQKELTRLAAMVATGVGQQPQYQSPWPELQGIEEHFKQLETAHLTTDDGKLGFVLLRLVKEEGFTGAAPAIAKLREIIDDTKRRNPGVKVGVTGMPILENDEMQSSQNDMMQASLLSLAGVAVLFIAGFGGIRHPLMTVGALLLAMAWSFGYITLAVGHLNILSVSFGAILIGLGIDFGIHYVARYLQLRQENNDCPSALTMAATSVGPGVVTGGITTALAFCTAALTQFVGIAELGIIAGGGIMLCMVSAVLVLPAMIFLSDRRRKNTRFPAALPVSFAFQPVWKAPAFVLIGSALITVLLGSGAVHLTYDHNLLNLQPDQIESVVLERQILSRSDRSVWFALSMARSREELSQKKAAFEKLPNVERVEEIVALTPPPSHEKAQIIRSIQGRLARLPAQPPVLGSSSPTELAGMFGALEQWSRNQDASLTLINQLSAARHSLSQMPPAQASRQLGELQMKVAGDLLGRFRVIAGVATPEPPLPQDVPQPLRDRFIGANGEMLLRVYARGDIWDMENLQKFVKGVESVDPQVTGHPVQTFYASRQMQQSYLHAALYSLLAVSIVLVIDFRSISHALLAMLPVVLGLAQLAGILGLVGIPLNPANMIVLPLILGIGIDDGVHVLHDFRRQQGPYRLSNSTATAVVLTSLTTMVGFGMMIFAKHQGLRSLGQVLTIGVLCCMFTSVVVLPALLALATRSRNALAGAVDDMLEKKKAGNATETAPTALVVHTPPANITTTVQAAPEWMDTAAESEASRDIIPMQQPPAPATLPLPSYSQDNLTGQSHEEQAVSDETPENSGTVVRRRLTVRRRAS